MFMLAPRWCFNSAVVVLVRTVRCVSIVGQWAIRQRDYDPTPVSVVVCVKLFFCSLIRKKKKVNYLLLVLKPLSARHLHINTSFSAS